MTGAHQMARDEHYIPALGKDWLTPLYDPLLRWGMQEERFKAYLVHQAQVSAGQQVLDLGCGTGTLTVMVKRAHPAAGVIGLDGDPRVLAMARAKAAQAGVEITWDEALADQLPYPDQQFERVISSLMFHHLRADDKQRAMREVFRVLKAGGEFHLVDFGPPQTAYARVIARSMTILPSEHGLDNVRGLLPVMLREAGFTGVEVRAQFGTIFGTLAAYAAQKSG